MAEWIGWAVAALFAMVGAVTVVRGALRWLLRPEETGVLVLAVPLSGPAEDAEERLRAAVGRLLWLDGPEDRFVLCLDGGLDPQARAVCEAAAREMPLIRLHCAEDRLGDILGTEGTGGLF